MLQKKRDSFRMRVLLKYQKDLMMKEGLLYRKVLLKGHDQPIAQFVSPEPFGCINECWYATMTLVTCGHGENS